MFFWCCRPAAVSLPTTIHTQSCGFFITASLGGNDITDTGAAAIAKGLEHNTKLQYLRCV